MNEREIIQCLAQNRGDDCEDVLQSIGDDCAVVRKDDTTAWLVTMDTLVENVHFNRSWHPPELLGRKAIAVNVSDIAAMGGVPRFVLLSLGAPRPPDEQWIRSFSRGVASACRQYGCLLIGGDTVHSPEWYSLCVTLIGEAPSDRVLYRSGAQAGDRIWVSGYLGQAAAGLELYTRGIDSVAPYQALYQAHLDPVARVDLGKMLADLGDIRSMMDLSDGMATDLAHLCTCSGTGAQVEAWQLPISTSLSLACDTYDLSAVSLAVRGGEDFELLFTAPRSADSDIISIGQQLGIQLSAVGTIEEGDKVVLINQGKQNIEELSYQGFDHFGPRCL